MNAIIVGVAVALANPAIARADDLRVFTTRAIATVLAEIGTEFERTTGDKLAARRGAVLGGWNRFRSVRL